MELKRRGSEVVTAAVASWFVGTYPLGESVPLGKLSCMAVVAVPVAVGEKSNVTNIVLPMRQNCDEPAAVFAAATTAF